MGETQPPRLRSGRWEVGVFLLAYLFYFGVRALTEERIAIAQENARRITRLQEQLGISWEDTLQAPLAESEFLTGLANAVYIYGHWPVLIGAGVLLFRYRPADYRVLRDAILISGAIGLVVFAAFPVAPPRLAGIPLADTVTEQDHWYRHLFPPSIVNEYAAVPSFHLGWNLLVGIIIFGATTNRGLRAFAVVMPIAMTWAVIVTANHYILDVLAGAVIVLMVLPLARRIGRGPTLGAHAGITRKDEGDSVPDRPPGG